MLANSTLQKLLLRYGSHVTEFYAFLLCMLMVLDQL